MALSFDLIDRVRRWLFDDALPLWARAGVADDGRFEERLTLDGVPDLTAPRRTRVQARQVYVFCEGGMLGWDGPWREIASRGLDRMIETCRGERPGSWVETTDADGKVVDGRADFYTHAFVVFSLAAAHRDLGDPRALPLALETLAFLDRELAEPDTGGWAEGLPPSLPRRQNPHMHLLEAMLAWKEVSDAPIFAERISQILALLEARLFDAGAGQLGEFFTQAWAIDPTEGHILEPGHHAEWVWLLGEAKRLGVADLPEAMTALSETALKGRDAHGQAVEQVGRDGSVLAPGRRLWGQTELIRAHIAMGDRILAEALTTRTLDTHLATPLPGLWFDRYDAEGRSVDPMVPASSLYHLTTAVSEILRGRG